MLYEAVGSSIRREASIFDENLVCDLGGEVHPDSADSYLQLVKAIDREHFAVHLDPVNLICSFQRYYNNGDVIRECFAKLGPYIKSCHGKDIILREKLTTHLDEVCPGDGGLNYEVFLKELN